MKQVIISLIAVGIGLTIGYFIWKPKPTAEKEFKMRNPNVMSEKDIDSLHKKYKAYLAKIGNGKIDSSMSFSVTFSKEFFIKMGRILEKDDKDTLDGVTVYMIRYDSRYKKAPINALSPREYEIPGLSFPEQNSIVFVPINKDRRPVFNLFNQKKSEDDGGYNHGQLCPDICDSDLKK